MCPILFCLNSLSRFRERVVKSQHFTEFSDPCDLHIQKDWNPEFFISVGKRKNDQHFTEIGPRDDAAISIVSCAMLQVFPGR